MLFLVNSDSFDMDGKLEEATPSSAPLDTLPVLAAPQLIDQQGLPMADPVATVALSDDLVAMVHRINVVQELDALEKVIDDHRKQLVQVRLEEAANLLNRIRALGLGDEVIEMLGGKVSGTDKSQKTGTRTMKAKYRLTGTNITWTGVGRMKKEFQEAIANGGKLEDYLIKD